MLTRLLLLLSLALFPVSLLAADPNPPTEHPALVDHSPKLSIAEALQVAQQYMADQKMDISNHFISGVRYFDAGSNADSGKGPYWIVTYECKGSSQGGKYFVHVYMNREAGHVGGR